MKTCKLLLLALCCGCVSASAAGKAGSEAPRIVNIVNFIRNIEPRSEEITETVLYETVARQAAQLAEYGLPATFLLQYDALINPRYRKLLTQDVYPGTEVGGWWEITQPHVEAAGLKWRGRYPWDWHADVGFATGYTPEERRKLVDVYMEKFKEVFGKYPTAIGSWFIDAYTLGYMYDKYGIVASCNCKDQIGTDGYTLWGGYWNQAYYPSRVNAYMPAQTREGQIPVPVFRMLGSDPIYQYDNCVGGALQGVISLEPVYGDSGGSRQWVEWFFRSMFEEPCLAFAYTQAGQENSFTWGSMEKGLNIQIPLMANRFRKGEIRVETLTRSGEWFRENFPVTPPTAVTALTDYREKDRKTVWYNSRYYRTNLLWEGGTLPAVTEKGKGKLLVEWPMDDGRQLTILLSEEGMEIAAPGKGPDWMLELTAAPGAALPFTAFGAKRVTAAQKGFAYAFDCTKGTIATDGTSAGSIFVLYPSDGKISLKFK